MKKNGRHILTEPNLCNIITFHFNLPAETSYDICVCVCVRN